MKWGISKLALRGAQTKAISQSASYVCVEIHVPGHPKKLNDLFSRPQTIGDEKTQSFDLSDGW